MKNFVGPSLVRGFTLLEALIAILVLSIGLLGVAAMQLKAMQSAHVAYQRSIATLAAQDAVERLWVALGSASRFCPHPSLVNGDWLDHWSGKLPGMVGSSQIVSDNDPGIDSPCEYRVTVAWEDSRFRLAGDVQDVSSLDFFTRLPGRE